MVCKPIDLQKNDELIRYKRLREINKELNRSLVKSLGKPAIQKGGKDLGILKRGALLFDRDDETSVFMDYCIHHLKIDNEAVVDRYIKLSSYDCVSDEATMLKAMSTSFFSVFIILDIEKDYICYVKDIMREEEFIIIDTGMGQTRLPNLMIASQLMKIPLIDKYMTTGAPFTVANIKAVRGLEYIIRKNAASVVDGVFINNRNSSFAKQVVRMAFKTKCMRQTEYADAGPLISQIMNK